MISVENKFIYIHSPKTGGTTIQDILLPFSDDKKYTMPFQDGIQSFEVAGDLTLGKHATLQDYADRLGDAFQDYTVVLSVRHPLARAVSGFFSPHKWVFKRPDDSWEEKEPYWDLKLFEKLLSMPNHKPSTDYIRVGGQIQKPDILIRHETFSDDLARCISALNLSVSPASLNVRRNASAAKSELFEQVLRNPEVWERVDAKYQADLSYFGYPTSAEFIR
ncbi:MAG: sulfotransferase family 2 domain-containing protein [Thalassovita sp.]